MTILISGAMELDPAHVERIVRDALPLIEEALAEEGCREYAWTVDPNHAGRIRVFEQWDTEAQLAAHFETPAYLQMKIHLRSAGPIKSVTRKWLIAHDEPVYDADGKPRADFFTLAK